MIYQPVLQWGVSAAGGGNSWAVASWYADGQGGHSFYSQLVPVNEGSQRGEPDTHRLAARAARKSRIGRLCVQAISDAPVDPPAIQHCTTAVHPESPNLQPANQMRVYSSPS